MTDQTTDTTTLQDVARASAELPPLDQLPKVGDLWMGDLHGKKVTLVLPCVLSHEERIGKKAEHSDAATRFDEIEAQIKAATAPLNEEKKAIRATMRRLSAELREGTVERSVDCIEKRDDQRGDKTIVRLDTERVAKCDALTFVERQSTLPLLDDADAKARKVDAAETPANDGTDLSGLAASLDAEEGKKSKKKPKTADAEASA